MKTIKVPENAVWFRDTHGLLYFEFPTVWEAEAFFDCFPAPWKEHYDYSCDFDSWSIGDKPHAFLVKFNLGAREGIVGHIHEWVDKRVTVKLHP